jgi:hypothetical protein
VVIHLSDRLLNLIAGPKHWFADAGDPASLIRTRVRSGLQGVYCLWWRDPTKLPRAPRVELDAGARGKLPVELKLHSHGLCDAAALYVGKGAVRSRLTSHVKPAPNSGRNPYWWMTQVVQEVECGESIRTHLGFSFIEEPSVFERTYAENFGIGILRPWFNLRLTS